MRRILAVLVLLVAATVLSKCNPAPVQAAVKVEAADLRVVAAGDTAKVTDYLRVAGNPDSLHDSLSMRGAPTVVARRLSNLSGVVIVGPIPLVPSPAYADGDTATVRACPVAFKGGVAYPGPCAFKLWTAVRAPSVTHDSLTVIGMDILQRPRSFGTGYQYTAVQPDSGAMCPVLKFKDGKYALRSADFADTTQYSCAWWYATTIDQKVRLNRVQTYAVGGLVFIRTWAASAARQAVIDTMCFQWAVTTGTYTPGTADQRCNPPLVSS